MSRISTLVTGAAVTAALTFGAAGLAGATTPSGSGSGSTSTAGTAAICARAPKVEARLEQRLAKGNTWLPKAQARLAKAKSANHPKVEARIEKRISRVEKLEAKGQQRLSRIQAKCGTSSTSSSSSTTGSTTT
jgi:hypothetical protein